MSPEYSGNHSSEAAALENVALMEARAAKVLMADKENIKGLLSSIRNESLLNEAVDFVISRTSLWIAEKSDKPAGFSYLNTFANSIDFRIQNYRYMISAFFNKRRKAKTQLKTLERLSYELKPDNPYDGEVNLEEAREQRTGELDERYAKALGKMPATLKSRADRMGFILGCIAEGLSIDKIGELMETSKQAVFETYELARKHINLYKKLPKFGELSTLLHPPEEIDHKKRVEIQYEKCAIVLPLLEELYEESERWLDYPSRQEYRAILRYLMGSCQSEEFPGMSKPAFVEVLKKFRTSIENRIGFSIPYNYHMRAYLDLRKLAEPKRTERKSGKTFSLAEWLETKQPHILPTEQPDEKKKPKKKRYCAHRAGSKESKDV